MLKDDMNKFTANNIASVSYKDGFLPLGNNVLIICEEDPNLMVVVHRKEDASKVCLPGGKQELNESSLEGAMRETYEETGLLLDADQMVPILSGMCESSNSEQWFWVTTYLVRMPKSIVFNSPEPEMMPKWMTVDEFMQRSSYPIYNKMVFNLAKEFSNL